MKEIFLIWYSYYIRINDKAVDRNFYKDVYNIYSTKPRAIEEMNKQYDVFMNDTGFIATRENLQMWVEGRYINK